LKEFLEDFLPDVAQNISLFFEKLKQQLTGIFDEN
jgi:hypothetical protein